LPFQVLCSVDSRLNRVAVHVTDPEWVASELRKAGIELPDLAQFVVVDGPSARGIDVCATSPVPGVAFPRQWPVEGGRIVKDMLVVGPLQVSDGCLRFASTQGHKGSVPVWPAEFTLREQDSAVGRDGAIEVLDGQGQVVARAGEEVCMNLGESWSGGPMPDCVLDQLPPACQGDYTIVGSEVRLNLRRDSDLFSLDVIPLKERSVILLKKLPALDGWADKDAPLIGTLTLWGRCPEVQIASDQRRYTPLWPAGYGARVEHGELEIVDGEGQLVARVGDEVRLPGGEIPGDWDSPRYRRLHDELPCVCNGPYWVVADPSSPTATPTATIQPRPDFIRAVGPEESSVVPLRVYRAGGGTIVLQVRSAETGYASSICVEPAIGYLLQAGDFFHTADSVLERIEFQVDGIERPVDQWWDGEVAHEMVQDGRIVASFGGPYVFCWKAPVGVGTHLVSFRFRQSSGDIQEYSWAFAVTQD
jgi:hypothetical protein